MDHASRPTRVDGARIVDVGELSTVLTAEGTRHLLSGTALAIWQLCDGSTSFDEMLEVATAMFTAEAGTLRADIEVVLHDLHRRGLIEWCHDVDDAPRYRREPHLLSRSLGDAVLLLALETGEMTELSGTAVAVWELLAQPDTVAGIGTELATWFGESPERISADIGPLLDELCRRGVLAVEQH